MLPMVESSKERSDWSSRYKAEDISLSVACKRSCTHLCLVSLFALRSLPADPEFGRFAFILLRGEAGRFGFGGPKSSPALSCCVP